LEAVRNYIRIARSLARRHADPATEADNDKAGTTQHLVTKENNRRQSVTAKPQLRQKSCGCQASKIDKPRTQKALKCPFIFTFLDRIRVENQFTMEIHIVSKA
jgi:hypothetical protein